MRSIKLYIFQNRLQHHAMSCACHIRHYIHGITISGLQALGDKQTSSNGRRSYTHTEIDFEL